MALRGINPLRAELEDARGEYQATAEQVERLEETYRKLAAAMGDYEKRIRDYQALVENLRRRVKEKDQLLAQVKKDYQARVRDYTVAVDELKERLKEACNMKARGQQDKNKNKSKG